MKNGGIFFNLKDEHNIDIFSQQNVNDESPEGIKENKSCMGVNKTYMGIYDNVFEADGYQNYNSINIGSKRPEINQDLHSKDDLLPSTNNLNRQYTNKVEDNIKQKGLSSKVYYLNKKYQLYKTEICRSHSETGFCKYGSKCQFAHNLSELRKVNRHPRYKTETCKTFWEEGSCPYGKRCCFIHIINNDLISNTINMQDSSESMYINNSSENNDNQQTVSKKVYRSKSLEIYNTYSEYKSDWMLRNEFNIKDIISPTIDSESEDYDIEMSQLEEYNCAKPSIFNNPIMKLQNSNLQEDYRNDDYVISSSKIRKPDYQVNPFTDEDEVFIHTLFIQSPDTVKSNEAFKWTSNPIFHINMN